MRYRRLIRFMAAPCTPAESRIWRMAMLAMALIVVVMFAWIAASSQRIEENTAAYAPERVAVLEKEIRELRARLERVESSVP